jgi:hypothetical protein
MAVAAPAVKQMQKKPGPEAAVTTETPWWDWVQNFSDDEFNYLMFYVHRCGPKIDRAAAGKPIAIAKLARRFDLDDILKEFGSGHYRFDVVKRNPRPGPGEKTQERIRQEYVDIINPDFPPRVPLGDWINDPENDMWRWAEEPLKFQRAQSQARIKTFEDMPAAGNGTNDAAGIFNTILEGVKTLRPEQGDNTGLASQLLGMVLKNQEAMQALNDPAKQLATLKTLLDSLQPKQPEGESLTMMMLGFFKEQTAALREEIKEMRSQPRKSMVEELKELGGAMAEIAPALGYSKRGAPNSNPNPGGNGTDWGNVAMQALEKIGPYVPAIVQSFTQPRPAPQPQQPGAPPQQAAIPAPPAQPNPGAEPVPNVAPEQVDRIRAFTEKYQGLLSEVMPFVVDYFRSKEGGHELRDWFIDRKGRVAWLQLKEDSGAELLTVMVSNHPGLKMILAPPEQVLQYFTDFFTDEGDDEDDDVEDSPTGAAHV